jgi:hypothetical protein
VSQVGKSPQTPIFNRVRALDGLYLENLPFKGGQAFTYLP